MSQELPRKRKPGGGRKPSATGYVKENINITPEANAILEKLPFGQTTVFVSAAIIEFANNDNNG